MAAPSEARPIDEETRARCAAFVGRTRTVADAMDPQNGRRLQASLDVPPDLAVGDVLPPMLHWAYFAEAPRISDLGPDGHERLGLFLPPVPFTRRMWASGTIRFEAPLHLGQPAEMRSTVTSVSFKGGRSGPLCFVGVEHAVTQGGGRCLTEHQTLVYHTRNLSVAAWAPTAPAAAGAIVHDDLQLVRYSAAIHNSHRIHWDRNYCREVEGYPDLVVHGPLLATRLFQALPKDDGQPAAFAFAARAPVFAGMPVRIVRDEADGGAGRIVRPDGSVAMEGRVEP